MNIQPTPSQALQVWHKGLVQASKPKHLRGSLQHQHQPVKDVKGKLQERAKPVQDTMQDILDIVWG